VCCSVLQCVAVCCSVLQCVAVCCSVLQCWGYGLSDIIAPELQHSAERDDVVYWKPKRKIKNDLQYSATHCNTLQHTATHCNTAMAWMAFSNELYRNTIFVQKETVGHGNSGDLQTLCTFANPSCQDVYRVAKTHRIPYLYRSFSAKVTYI